MGDHATFIHPHGVYRLRHPAEWETLQQDNARSCGFGPRDRSDVGLWITILPFRLDTSELVNALPRMFSDSLGHGSAINVRRDPSLKPHGFKADVAQVGQAGHHWIAVEGDVVLLATSTVPVAEAPNWGAQFDAVMRTLEVTRDDELAHHQLCVDLLTLLHVRFPDRHYQVDVDGIRGDGHVIRIHALHRKVAAHPDQRGQILQQFVDELAEGLEQGAGTADGAETWEEAAALVLPTLKHVSYFRNEGPTAWLVRSKWLPEVRIAYALRHPGRVRFVHTEDLKRWSRTEEEIHERALSNLGDLPWPTRPSPSTTNDGRIIAIRAGDAFEASRILHPQFHTLMRTSLGSPFLAAIPDRDTLLGFSDEPGLQRELTRRVARDHKSSAYPITDRIFRVTPDGVAPAEPLPDDG